MSKIDRQLAGFDFVDEAPATMGKVVGFDVGGESTMVVDDSGVIVRNELGGHSSSSLVGFSGMERYVGEAAVAQLSTNAKNTARIGERLSGNGALDAHRPGAGEAAFTVSGYAGEETTSFGDDALCCALLRRCGSLAAASLGPSCREGAADLRGAFAVPTCWDAKQRAARRNGAVAGLPPSFAGVDLVRADACLAAVYEVKHASLLEAGEAKVVAVVDVGRLGAHCSVYKFAKSEAGAVAAAILGGAAAQDDACGTAAMDALVFDALSAKLPADVEKPAPGSKRGGRLLGAAERLRKLLSTMETAKTTAENMGDERDVPLEFSRDELRETCASVLESFKGLLEKALANAAVDKVDAVELVGGGSRVAVAQEVAKEVFGVEVFGAKLDDATLAHGAALCVKKRADADEALDKARKDLVAAKTRKSQVDADLADAKTKLEEERKAAPEAPPPPPEGEEKKEETPPPKAEDSVVQVRVNALGEKALQAAVAECAALSAVEEAQAATKAALTPFVAPEADDAAALAALRTAEDAMVARDDGVKAVADKRNALETKILELRSAKNGKHYKLFEEKSSDFGALLDDAEEWLWSDEAYAATAEVMQAKLDEMSAKAQDMVPAYFETIEKERLDMEKQLEAEAAAAAANDDDDDEAREDRLHADTRKLKFGDRFRLVEKNKKEGTELFKDGNITHAAKRYKDALGHAAKFRDLNPEQTAQTTKIKVDLHVNMALCWTKLDNVDQALKSAEEALKLEPAHPKALYRRAAAFEKTSKFDEAKKDLNAVLKQNPEDKAALALAKRVDAQLARQKAKAKKMASKMFA